MHTYRQFREESFGVTIAGRAATLTELFPDWSRADRFGIVVDRPLGMLGADLLVQAAMERYYSLRRETHPRVPTYPEVYVFHVGGPHGNYGPYDVAPYRKEVAVEPGVWELLVAIEERGITHLAVPDSTGSEFEWSTVPGGWFYGTAFLDHVRRVFAYSPDGVVADADVTIRAVDDVLLENRRGVLDAEAMVPVFAAQTEESVRAVNLGYTSLADAKDYGVALEERLDEVPRAARDEYAARLGDLRVEEFRRTDADEGLRLVKAAAERVSGVPAGPSPDFPYRRGV